MHLPPFLLFLHSHNVCSVIEGGDVGVEEREREGREREGWIRSEGVSDTAAILCIILGKENWKDGNALGKLFLGYMETRDLC